MTVLVRGAEKVRELERALGGAPPADALARSKGELLRRVSERFEQRRHEREQTAKLARPLRERTLRLLVKDDPKLEESLQAARAHFERREKRAHQPPRSERFEPRVTLGSINLVKTPPYDDAWSFQSADHTTAQADAAAGRYDLAVQSFGDGSLEVAAGVAIAFSAPAEDPQQRVAAVLDYADDWWDSAMGYVAHNDFRTRLWVWGATEQRWVVQAEVSPGWSDGVGWAESHGNDPQGDEGRVAVETFFPAMAGSWYQAWIWSDASIYADSGIFGFAASSIQGSVSVPLVVFGSL